MAQLNLFVPVDSSTPRSRRTDPETSKAAAAKIARSGRADAHKALVLRTLELHDGSTYREIGTLLGGGDWVVEAQRRLQDLFRDGRVRKGDTRECSVNGNKMTTWWIRRMT